MVLLYFDVFWRTISKSRWKTWLFCSYWIWFMRRFLKLTWRLENFDTRLVQLLGGLGMALGRLGSSNPINPLLWSIICSMNIAISRQCMIIWYCWCIPASWYVPICVGYTFHLTLLVKNPCLNKPRHVCLVDYIHTHHWWHPNCIEYNLHAIQYLVFTCQTPFNIAYYVPCILSLWFLNRYISSISHTYHIYHPYHIYHRRKKHILIMYISHSYVTWLYYTPLFTTQCIYPLVI
jgi:hypothetical protein